jgi:hypothetical protein
LGGFGDFLKLGATYPNGQVGILELRTKPYFLSYHFFHWMRVCEVLRSQNFSRPLYSFKTTFSCPPLYSKLRIYPSFKAEDLLIASKPRPYTQCTHPFYILQSLETVESCLAGPEAVSLFQQDQRLRVPFLISLALMEGTHIGLSALNSYVSFFLRDLKVSGFMEVDL